MNSIKWIMPCKIFAPPLTKVMRVINKVAINNVELVPSSPNVNSTPWDDAAIRMMGTVSPMVESVVPRQMLTARCIRLARAARIAPKPSGVKPRLAIIYPPKAVGALSSMIP